MAAISMRFSTQRFRLVLVLTFVFTLLVGTTTVIQGQENVRVASLPNHPDPPVATFHRLATTPWETLGPQPAYLYCRASEILKRERFNNVVTKLGFVLSKNLIDQLQKSLTDVTLNLHFSVSQLPPQEKTENGRFSLKGGANAVELKFSQSIDWNQVAAEVAWKAIGVDEQTNKYAKVIQKLGQTDTLSVGAEENPPTETEAIDRLKQLKSVWPIVDGGLVAYATQFPKTRNRLVSDGDSTEQLSFDIYNNSGVVAIGIDAAAGSDQFNFKFVFVPREGSTTDAVSMPLQNLLDFVKQDLASGSDDYQPTRQIFETAQITTIESTVGPVVVLTCQLNETTAFGLLSQR